MNSKKIRLQLENDIGNTLVNIKDNSNVSHNGGGQIGNSNAEKWTEEIAIELGQGLIDWLSMPGKDNMFMEGYLQPRGLYRTIIVHLCTRFKSFYELIERAKEITEYKLVKYGIDGELSPPLTKFILINNFGYQDKSTMDFNDVTPKRTTLNIRRVIDKPANIIEGEIIDED